MKIDNKMIISSVALTVIGVFLYWQNNDIVITNIKFKSSKVPKSFNEYKILQISDFHNKEFGKNQNKLVSLTNEIKPNIIVVTGDSIDSRKTNMNVAIEYLSQASKIAKTYYISGNHESRIDGYNKFEDMLLKAGVTILDNKSKTIKINEENINLIGMKDISFINSKNKEEEFSKTLNKLKDNLSLNILLSHRPELIDIYVNENIDLVFTGHAHGGQIRIPIIGGLFAPGQGMIPKYTDGVYKKDNTKMVVSRGLGNSLFPFRIFNRPEIIVTTLKSQ